MASLSFKNALIFSIVLTASASITAQDNNLLDKARNTVRKTIDNIVNTQNVDKLREGYYAVLNNMKTAAGPLYRALATSIENVLHTGIDIAHSTRQQVIDTFRNAIKNLKATTPMTVAANDNTVIMLALNKPAAAKTEAAPAKKDDKKKDDKEKEATLLELILINAAEAGGKSLSNPQISEAVNETLFDTLNGILKKTTFHEILNNQK